MRYLLATLPLAMILFALMSGATGCGESHNPVLAMVDKTESTPLPTTVDGIARWHNLRVQETVDRYHAGGRRALPEMESTLAQWGCLDRLDRDAARRDWEVARRVIERGLRTEDLASLVARGLDRAASDPEVSPRFLDQLRVCMERLQASDRSQLPAAVHQLAAMARQEGTLREKGLAGVLLGSMQRAAAGTRLPPDHPYYPVVLGFDQVGTMYGGPAVGTFYSAHVELMIFLYTYPGPWW